MVLEDEAMCREFGWGELLFEEALSLLKSSLKQTKTTVGALYQLVGFPYAFMKGLVKAFTLEHELPTNNDREDKTFNKQPDNIYAEPSHDPSVHDQCDNPHRPTKNKRSEKKRQAEERNDVEGHSNKKEEATEEREKKRRAEEGKDTDGHSYDKEEATKERLLGGINVDIEDMISDGDGTKKFLNIDSTICNVETSHDEQKSTHVSPLKSKGFPLKKRTYIRIKKGSKSAISDVSYELISRPSSMDVEHLDTIFYYTSKKAKYEPNISVKFTTTDFVFRNKIDALYQDFVKNWKDFSFIPKKHEFRSISEASIVMQTYRGTRNSNKVIQKVMLPYQTLIPYFLQRVNFYLEKRIDKSENDTLPINMADELPQQTQCDCGTFVCAFAGYFIHGRDILKEIDTDHTRMRRGALLWDYGKRKLQVGIESNTIEKVSSLCVKEKRKRTHKD
ncbi:hypothetical protein FXO38_14697 [Capsicum annuum]|uniref:Ubiquitin-like protease family profile domain-containing protein n=1 Tax=Capsicum annuum TaxID=4072 RepID=A0A2G2YWS0_CAPAN|nr:hypothetical protein FXO38_14697 [Capsicum annuum]KAF3678159.1 hypothetical protein FXO37_04521 [Capsicum annuum]PHT74071.1 hypothetical protein T459_21348 [Capsicum annuum]